ncbi:MAG: AarF/ABC1/UbiB kinase family protein [Anaerolineales bacterium]
MDLSQRYRKILWFFARLLLSLVYWEILLPKLGLRFLTDGGREGRLAQASLRFRKLAIEMGGVLIKVGQFLSTRVDVLPTAFTEPLEGLQDEVPPAKFEQIRPIAEAELGGTLEQVFAWFDARPLAAASIGQAHCAHLRMREHPNGDVRLPLVERIVPVVVKVQRPNIEQIVAVDLRALRQVGVWLQWYAPLRRRVNVSALLDDFAATLHEEMDYLAEGRNAETFAANFAEQPRIRVPKVYWSYTTRRVITLEDVGAIKINDYAAITAAGIERAEVAKLLFDTYLQQIFQHSFFHADPHPGNLFVSPMADGAWQLTFIDFGMMGKITPRQRAGLREMVIAVSTQDVKRVVKGYDMLGFLLPNANVRLIEQAGTQVFARFWGKSTLEFREVSLEELQKFAQEFKNLLYDLPFQIPEDLLLLGRAASILSGMCSGLDPDFNIWYSLMPYTQELVAEQQQGDLWEQVQAEAQRIGQKLLQLPGRLDGLLLQLEHGDLRVQNPQLTEQVRGVERAVQRLGNAVLFAALLWGALTLAQHQQPAWGAVLGIAAFFTLLGVLLSREGG